VAGFRLPLPSESGQPCVRAAYRRRNASSTKGKGQRNSRGPATRLTLPDHLLLCESRASESKEGEADHLRRINGEFGVELSGDLDLFPSDIHRVEDEGHTHIV
jgi:hypothetical protein